MDLKLNGKVALVAGGSAGIGAAGAEALAREGARLAIAARPGELLSAAIAKLAAMGAEAAPAPADLAQPDAADAAVAATLAAYGRLDVLVVSIGAAKGGASWTLPDGVWRDAIDLKLMGLVRLLRAVTPVMQAQGDGRIVVVVGNNSQQPRPGLAPGAAVNAACLAVVKSLAGELAPFGVRINAISPGPTRTARWDGTVAGLAAVSGRAVEEEEAFQLGRIPTGQICDPAEVGRLIAVLASPISANLTGATLVVDGGETRMLG